MGWFLGTLLVVLALVTALLAGTLIHLRRQRPQKDPVWAARVCARMSASNDEDFRVDGEGHVRGLLHGRPAVVGLDSQRKTVVILRLTMPVPDPEAPERPSLRGLPSPDGHRVGRQWVQYWRAGVDADEVPQLAAEALGLARAVEAQASAPWALFAGQNGLAFHEGRDNRPCFMQGEFDGVQVRVQLDGLREPPLRTLIVAGRRQRGRVQRILTGTQVLTGATDMGALLSRYEDAEIDEDTVKIAIPGMVVDDLGERLRDAVAMARALARGAWS